MPLSHFYGSSVVPQDVRAAAAAYIEAGYHLCRVEDKEPKDHGWGLTSIRPHGPSLA